MKHASGAAFFVVASLFAATGCGGAEPEARWPAATTHVESASLPVAYCSARYQAQFGWPDPEKTARVCQCESHGNPHAVSRNRLYRGLFQFSYSTWQSVGGGDPFDPNTNSEHAYRLWKRRGWQPWPTCGKR
jgi:hypothetical protein